MAEDDGRLAPIAPRCLTAIAPETVWRSSAPQRSARCGRARLGGEGACRITDCAAGQGNGPGTSPDGTPAQLRRA
jgi:hypothetical protein